MSKTRIPSCAKFVAKHIAVVDLPSDGRELVTSITLGAPDTVENCRAVLSDRYASASGELGDVRTSCVSALASPISETGVTPSTGKPKSPSISSGDLKVSSQISRTKMTPADEAVPNNKAISRFVVKLGLIGPPGSCARSMIEMLLLSAPPATASSLYCWSNPS